MCLSQTGGRGCLHSVWEAQGDGENLWRPGRGGWPVAMAGQSAVPKRAHLRSCPHRLPLAGFYRPLLSQVSSPSGAPAEGLVGEEDAWGEEKRKGCWASHAGAFGSCSGAASNHMSFLPLTCVPSTWNDLRTHLPRSSSSFILNPCACPPGDGQCPSWLPCSVAELFAASDHGFSSVFLHSWVSDSR